MVLATTSMIPILSWLSEGYRDDDLSDFSYYGMRIFLAVFVFGLSAILWIMQGLIAKVLVPIPNGSRCPRCNHLIHGMSEPLCTECGLELTPEFLESHEHSITAGPHVPNARIAPFLIANRRSIVANLTRILGVLIVLWGILGTLGSVAMLLMNDSDYYLYSIVSIIQSFFTLILGIVLVIYHIRIARFCVLSQSFQEPSTFDEISS